VVANGTVDRRDRWTRDGLFPVGSPIRRAARAINAIPMAGRMVLMELAHPAIAAAVNDNDHFRSDPVQRSVVTAEAIGDVIHGSSEDAQRVSGHLAAVHARVNGPGYRASDPGLLLWVAATYFDSVLLATDLWRQSMTTGDREELFEEMSTVFALLGVLLNTNRSHSQCPSLCGSNARRAHRQPIAIDLARDIFWPSTKGRHQAPMALYYRLVSFGYLPERLRSQFGYEWTPRHERALRSLVWAAPSLRPISEATLRRLADGQGRPLHVLMSVAGYRASHNATPRSLSP